MILRDGFAVVDPGESSGDPAAAGGVAVRVTIDAGSGCRNLVQRLLEIGPPGTDRPAIAGSEEIGYVAAGSGRLLAFEENGGTNERLRQAGFEVRTFPGGEIGINGGGGP